MLQSHSKKCILLFFVSFVLLLCLPNAHAAFGRPGRTKGLRRRVLKGEDGGKNNGKGKPNNKNNGNKDEEVYSVDEGAAMEGEVEEAGSADVGTTAPADESMDEEMAGGSGSTIAETFVPSEDGSEVEMLSEDEMFSVEDEMPSGDEALTMMEKKSKDTTEGRPKLSKGTSKASSSSKSSKATAGKKSKHSAKASLKLSKEASPESDDGEAPMMAPGGSEDMPMPVEDSVEEQAVEEEEVVDDESGKDKGKGKDESMDEPAESEEPMEDSKDETGETSPDEPAGPMEPMEDSIDETVGTQEPVGETTEPEVVPVTDAPNPVVTAETITQSPTAVPTETPATVAPTAAATQAVIVTESPTAAAVVTESPTAPATQAVTESPTVAATQAVTESPTAAATTAVTGSPTAAATTVTPATEVPEEVTTSPEAQTDVPGTDSLPPVTTESPEVPAESTEPAVTTGSPTTSVAAEMPTSSPTTPVGAECPTIVGINGTMEFNFVFADREPTEEEIASLEDATLTYFVDLFRQEYGDNVQGISGSIDSSSFDFGPPPVFTMNFGAEIPFTGCAPPLDDVNELLSLDDAQYEDYLTQYVFPIEPAGQHIFVLAARVVFEGSASYVDAPTSSSKVGARV